MNDKPEASTQICLNCAVPVEGNFCATCGQPSSTSRYTLASLLEEIYSQVRKLDLTTSTRTIWELTRRPGEFVRGYMEGRRVGFLNPVKFFFYSFVVQVLFGTFALWLTHDQQFETLSKLDYRLEFVGLISTIFWGGLWAVMYRKSELNTVENMASALFFVGQTNFYGVFIDAISIPLHSIFPTASGYLVLAEVGVVVVYGLFFARKLFGEPWFLILPKQFLLSLLYLIIVVVVAAGGILVSALS